MSEMQKQPQRRTGRREMDAMKQYVETRFAQEELVRKLMVEVDSQIDDARTRSLIETWVNRYRQMLDTNLFENLTKVRDRS